MEVGLRQCCQLDSLEPNYNFSKGEIFAYFKSEKKINSSQRRGSGRRPEPRRAANFKENGHKKSNHFTPSAQISLNLRKII